MNKLGGVLKNNVSGYRTLIHIVERMAYTILKTSLMAHVMACIWIWIIIHYQGEPVMPQEEQEKIL